MKDVDRLIDEALDAEERELLRTLDEPGFFTQTIGIFEGPTGWANVVMMGALLVLFVAGVWAAWNFFEAAEPVTQLRWGLPAAVLLILATMIKMALILRMEGNRLLREVKRVELQIARMSRHYRKPKVEDCGPAILPLPLRSCGPTCSIPCSRKWRR